jgi:hypothetical protein
VEAQERELLATLDVLMAEETWLPADAASGARQLIPGKMSQITFAACSYIFIEASSMSQKMRTKSRNLQQSTPA